jgi:signal transduction histidine kinase
LRSTPFNCFAVERFTARFRRFAAQRIAARRLQGYKRGAMRIQMTTSTRISLVAAAAAVFLSLVAASQTYLSMLTHGHSFMRLFAWQMGCWGPWAIVAPWLVRVSGRFSIPRLVLFGVLLTVVQIVVAAQFTVWLRPYQPVVLYTYVQSLNLLWPVRIVIDPLAYGLLIVGGKAFAAYERANQLALRESQLEAEVTKARLDALSLEIQPHFLFNTLNSIAALIRMHDNRGALSMLVGLSDLMRSTLDRTGGQVAPLGDEVALVRRYVDIQRARFGDRLDVSYRIDRACESMDVPTFLLQPLVENAMRHGLSGDGQTCHVEIGAAANGDGLRLWVSDDGRGLPAGFDLQQHAGTGLRNTSSRIDRLYGPAARLTVRNNIPAGTTVELTLPRTSVRQLAGEPA